MIYILTLSHYQKTLAHLTMMRYYLATKQALIKNTDGSFKLFRIGDAVSARNTHAAIYDALRLMKDI